MIKKLIVCLVCIGLLAAVAPVGVFATNGDDIVILYENDVHCAVEGYTKLSAMKKELQESYAHVGVVSGGDYIQGNSLGVISRGEYIVELMNLVGYDALTLGNHEFDYRLERLEELVEKMNTKPVCCNFQKIGEEESYFEPFTMVTYGDVKIAYIGITTPSTITTSTPTQFKDENGEFIYTFRSAVLYEVVQKNIDLAKAQGADYVIAVSHIGYAENEVYGDLEDVETLIENTDGLDVVLDAHSHSVIEGRTLLDRGGNQVLLSSTGTKFEYIGKLTISDGKLETQLIKTETYEKTDPVVDAYVKQIYEEYSELGERKVGDSSVNLIIKDANGKRLVRNTETNMGQLCADAFRYVTDADIGYLNGGGIRAEILEGEITFNDLLNVFPFNNSVVMAALSGQTIKDMMEMAMCIWPEENGSFPHLSGLKFSVDTFIASSVVLDENDEFVRVDGEYRVYDLMVFDKASGEYLPLELERTYTFAASNFFLLDYGSGMTMLKNGTILQNDGMLDVEALERYIDEVLGGTIGGEYAQVKANLAFTQGKDNVPESSTPETTAPESSVPESSAPETTATEVENPETADTSRITVIFVGLALCATLVLMRKKAEENK